MANRPAVALGLRDGDREELTKLTRASSGRPGLAQRARIVLLAAEGESNTAVAAKVGVSRPTVIDWRNRYAAQGIAGFGFRQDPWPRLSSRISAPGWSGRDVPDRAAPPGVRSRFPDEVVGVHREAP